MKDTLQKTSRSTLALTFVLVTLSVAVGALMVKRNMDMDERYQALRSENRAIKGAMMRLKKDAPASVLDELKKAEENGRRLLAEKTRLESERNALRSEMAALLAQAEEAAGQGPEDKQHLSMLNRHVRYLHERTKVLEAKPAVPDTGTAEAYGVAGSAWQMPAAAPMPSNAALEREIARLRIENSALLKSSLQVVEKFSRRQDHSAKLKKTILLLKAKMERTEKAAASRYETYVKQTNEALEESEKRLSDMRRETSLLHYNLGVAYVRQSDFTNAADEFKRAIELNTNDALAHYNLAAMYDLYLKRPQDAIPHYESYLRLLPRAPDAQKVQYKLFQLRLSEGVAAAKARPDPFKTAGS